MDADDIDNDDDCWLALCSTTPSYPSIWSIKLSAILIKIEEEEEEKEAASNTTAVPCIIRFSFVVIPNRVDGAKC